MNKKDSDSKESRYKEIDKTYEADGISIRWQPHYCIHVGECFGRLLPVFDPKRRPWVIPDAATPDEIAETILHCPSGALHFTRTDDGAQEEPGEQVTVDPQPNGPLYLRGRIQVRGPDGSVIREDTRVALCRCGGSANKPYCDGSHKMNGFRS